MGYIHSKDVEVHVSKTGNICVKYKFIDRNGQQDFMYIGLNDHIIDEVKRLKDLRESKHI